MAALRSASIALVLALAGCEPTGDVGYWLAPPPPTAADASVDAASVADSGSVDELKPAAAGAAAAMAPAPPDACTLARSGNLEVTILDTNAVTYNFAKGAALPAGQYRVAYADGCRRYDDTAAWTVHASKIGSALSAAGRGGCYLIMSNGQAIDLAPGTAGLVVADGPDPAGAYATYDECVAANRKELPFDLAFSGGTLGIMNAGDSNPAKTSGEDIGRRSPTYRLTRLDSCPP